MDQEERILKEMHKRREHTKAKENPRVNFAYGIRLNSRTKKKKRLGWDDFAKVLRKVKVFENAKIREEEKQERKQRRDCRRSRTNLGSS
jgi:hypothetical protein